MSGESLEQLAAEARAVHGPGARVVAAQKVTVGGVGGLFARKHYEVTVEVPDPATDRPVARVTITQPASRAGIAALLADADAADGFDDGARPGAAAAAPAPSRDPFDEVLAGQGAARRPAPEVVVLPRAADAGAVDSPRRAARAAAAAASAASATTASSSTAGGAVPAPSPADVSTRTDAFADIMDDFTFNGIAVDPVVAPAAADDARPGPLTTAAEFLAAAAATTSPALAAAGQADLPAAPGLLRGAGDLVVVVGRPGDAFRVAAQMASAFGLRSVDVSDRRSAILARATGVHEGSSVVTALAWDDDAPDALRSIGADQLWVAVDVGRKHDDTARWVEAVRAVQPVAAVAVVGAQDTATPGTVHLLGVPVGWRE